MLSGGEGPALLFLHGAGDRGEWLPVLDELAAGHTVYRPDHPGFNWSGDDERIDSVHDLGFFYLDLLDQLEIDSVVVVGASLGGWLAVELAMIAPHRVERLVLIDPAGIRVEGVEVPDYFLLNPQQLSEKVWREPSFAEANLQWALALADDTEAYGRYLRGRASTAHLCWNPYFHDPKLLHRLHRITCDALVVWGSDDGLFPVDYGRRWVELLPNASLSVIEGAGHLPHVERLDDFMRVASPFLAR
jgi:pimeloyl-ACP methyl ester carboxylesterase